MKRVLDALITLVALIVLAPIMLLVAGAIWLEDGAPVVFRQRRVGRDLRPFTIYKFRSMPLQSPDVPSADATSLTVTRVGRFIRRTNLDELPQLWNVLKGDMSIVGPRPALPSQRSLVAARRAAGVYRVRPGLTGLAQVNSYSGMPEPQKVEWDRLYVQQISLMADLAIVCRTFGYLMRKPPVY